MTITEKSRENSEVRAFILNNMEGNPTSISTLTVKHFGLSRNAVSGYMKRLVNEGLIEAKGNTKARSYQFKPIVDIVFKISLSAGLTEEDVIWRYKILPHIKNVKQNVIDICQYGFTEILNNAIDHSGSFEALVSYQQTYNKIHMLIGDYGVGIFEKIQKDFNLPDARSALLELAKGKLTSDKKNHSGEGIFFTSRMFDMFSISSSSLYYTRKRQDHDQWLIETEDALNSKAGTTVIMEISPHTDRTKREVFDQYQKEGDIVLAFRKTHVPLKLSKYPNEQLVSRSQAKRVLSRFEDFTEVLLDFDGVQEIGQGFADEIFRVFKNAHPDIQVIAIRTTPEIDQMIQHVRLQAEKSNT